MWIKQAQVNFNKLWTTDYRAGAGAGAGVRAGQQGWRPKNVGNSSCHPTPSHFWKIPDSASRVDFLPSRQWRVDAITLIVTQVPSTAKFSLHCTFNKLNCNLSFQSLDNLNGASCFEDFLLWDIIDLQKTMILLNKSSLRTRKILCRRHAV